ncbi:hypothetical protein [Pseudalkalibacillus caeni]|uniref:DUF1640 domain-containing protein n=1 Tax=Exobacillus caeni TaxID=2574798 RepID=A0A5R9EZC3_9BACL|nr:hypothetical protein [Pseudalkalibacillus caeni]TLS35450.1 hypothetical protein FCL54_20350 [Pseudalkalibacillus caeni]
MKSKKEENWGVLIEELHSKTDENAVRVIVSEALKEKRLVDDSEVTKLVQQELDKKGLITNSEMESHINAAQLKMIKWVVGTGISAVAITLSLLKLFI